MARLYYILQNSVSSVLPVRVSHRRDFCGGFGGQKWKSSHLCNIHLVTLFLAHLLVWGSGLAHVIPVSPGVSLSHTWAWQRAPDPPGHSFRWGKRYQECTHLLVLWVWDCTFSSSPSIFPSELSATWTSRFCIRCEVFQRLFNQLRQSIWSKPFTLFACYLSIHPSIRYLFIS